jgi:general secretion pathway protein D
MSGGVAIFLPSETESPDFIALAPCLLKGPQMQQSILLSPGQHRFHLIHMKRLLLSLTLVGIVACSLAAFAQTNSPAPDATPASATPAQDTAQPAPAAEAPAPATANEAAQAASRPVQPGVVIPLIVMDDVPLTDAIRNLARQSGINYMLDPKIGFGQVGPDGKPAGQPNVSIRWENITAEQALAALLNNYTLQLVEDPKSKIVRITIKDPAAPPPLTTVIIQLKYASPSNVVSSVQATLTDKRSKVIPDTRTSQLIVVATEPEMAEVQQLIERLDTKTKQVLIEARLLETMINPTTAKGIDWSGTLAAQHVSYGNGVLSGTTSQNSSQNSGWNSSQNGSQNNNNTITSPGTTTTTTLPGGQVTTITSPSDSSGSQTANSAGSSGASSGISSSVSTLLSSVIGNGGLSLDTAKGLNPSTFFLNADGVHATLSFLNTYAETKVISSPRTVTLDNEMASIEVGTLYPIVNTTAGTANTTGGSTITYSNLTVSLKVTPRISANNYVRLQVTPRVMRLGSQVTTTVNGLNNSVDSFETREMITSVLIPSGNTLVMGGLISDEIHNGNTKVPLLGDLPFVGLLFRSDTKSRIKSNMLVFITPTIVEDEDFQPTKSTFLKSKVPVKDTVEDGDWSAWDSGKPKDWSKRKPSMDDSLTQPGTTLPDQVPGQ